MDRDPIDSPAPVANRSDTSEVVPSAGALDQPRRTADVYLQVLKLLRELDDRRRRGSASDSSDSTTQSRPTST